MNTANDKQNDIKFVQVLKATMLAKNLNQSQIADLLGIRQSQISNWLNGATLPNYNSLQLLKTKLNVQIEDFFE